MSIKNKTSSLIALSIILVSAILVLRAQKKESPSQDEKRPSSQEQQIKEYAKQFPIAEFSAPEPANLEERARRDAVGKKYDDELATLSEGSFTIASFAHWAAKLSALPVEKSRLVIIGEIVEARAYLTKDKTGVYSEFRIRVDEVLKADSNFETAVGSSLTASRPGGRVRYPSGHITFSFVIGQGMPQVGQRYVFFLASDEQQADFDILTGYELKGDHIALLDSPSGHPITKYKGADKQTFLNELRAAIKKSPQDETAR